MKQTVYTSPVSIGDKVYKIQNYSKSVWQTCDVCGGTRVISLKGSEYSCPQCYGRGGEFVSEPQKFQVLHHSDSEGLKDFGARKLTVGQVRLEHTGTKSPEWVVMCKETGIGSGTLHNCNDLFATVADAQAECDRRNGE